jgi:hypothetical protein
LLPVFSRDIWRELGEEVLEAGTLEDFWGVGFGDGVLSEEEQLFDFLGVRLDFLRG